jgi:hypothetical protein
MCINTETCKRTTNCGTLFKVLAADVSFSLRNKPNKDVPVFKFIPFSNQ